MQENDFGDDDLPSSRLPSLAWLAAYLALAILAVLVVATHWSRYH
jgi:hypothetical protein